MVISCHEIWKQISAYIDGEISAEVRAEMEEHFAQCRHCSALVDSTHNLLVLIGDERTFTLPIGFSERLRTRIEAELKLE